MTDKPVKLSVVRAEKRAELDDTMAELFEATVDMINNVRDGDPIEGFVVMVFTPTGTAGVNICPFKVPECVFPEYVAEQVRQLEEIEN